MRQKGLRSLACLHPVHVRFPIQLCLPSKGCHGQAPMALIPPHAFERTNLQVLVGMMVSPWSSIRVHIHFASRRG